MNRRPNAAALLRRAPGTGRHPQSSADRPALDIQLPAGTAALPARLDALLDDFHPFAIQERDARQRAGAVARRVYFFSRDDRDGARRAIVHALAPDGAVAHVVDVPDDGWAERTQARLRAVRVGRLVVAPPWDLPPDATVLHRDVIVIQPSMGFGTGHHASTRLCLRALQAGGVVRAGTTALDLGTGSGILAISTVRLGAREVLAVDRDEDALANAGDNLARNDVASVVHLRHADVRSIDVPARELVTANLTGSFLARHAALLSRYVQPGGHLVAGGLTIVEEADVRTAFAPALAPTARDVEDGWVTLTLRRGDAGPTTSTWHR